MFITMKKLPVLSQLIANKNRICYKTPGFALVKILPVVSCIRKYNPQELIANKNQICYKTPGFALVKILPVVSCIRKYNPQESKHVDLGLNARIRLTVSHLEFM